MLCWIVLLLASLVSEQVAPKPKYKVVKADKPDRAITALNASADQGYRLLVPGRMFILRLESTPPDTYRYMAMDLNGGPVHFLNWLNDQGAHGYRWVPGAGVMEKEPHPKNYEYESVGGSGWGPNRSPTPSYLAGQGYHPLGVATFFAFYIGAPPRELFFERELGSRPEPMRISQRREVEIADAMRAGNVMKQVDALAKKGYRYLCPDLSQKGGGLASLMQECGRECGATFEYRYFDVHNVGQLVRELNEQGKEGFRVVPSALTSRPHVLERGSEGKETFAYHVLQSKDPVTLEQALNGPEQEGYEPIGYVWRAGVWTGEGSLLLEKVSTVSATPQSPAPEPPPSK